MLQETFLGDGGVDFIQKFAVPHSRSSNATNATRRSARRPQPTKQLRDCSRVRRNLPRYKNAGEAGRVPARVPKSRPRSPGRLEGDVSYVERSGGPPPEVPATH